MKIPTYGDSRVDVAAFAKASASLEKREKAASTVISDANNLDRSYGYYKVSEISFTTVKTA